MTDARMKSFFDRMVRAGVVKAEHRLSQVLHPAVRQQGRRQRPAAQELVVSPVSPPATEPVVSLRGVGKVFGSGVTALDGLDLDVRDGEFLSLLGPSGCGKSTALRIIAGLSEPTRGTVTWAGERRRARQGHRLRVPGADADAVGDGVRQRLSAAEACRRRPEAQAAPRVMRGAGARRPWRFCRCLSAPTVRRHADAGVDRARAGDRAARAADGRAVRRARRDHPLQAQRRPDRAVARTAA